MDTEKPLLTIELVPASSWGSNLRSVLPSKEWDILRKACYAAAGHKCEICGGKGPRHPVECHEVWDYNEENGVQTLIRLIALCPMCHQTKHFGLAQMRGLEAKVIAHMMKVNKWGQKQCYEHIRVEGEIFRRRSTKAWTLDLSSLNKSS